MAKKKVPGRWKAARKCSKCGHIHTYFLSSVCSNCGKCTDNARAKNDEMIVVRWVRLEGIFDMWTGGLDDGFWEEHPTEKFGASVTNHREEAKCQN